MALKPLRNSSQGQELESALRPIVVALTFRPADAGRLWDLASRHYIEDTPQDVGLFTKAARAAERGVAVVIECTYPWQLEEVREFFPRYGIQPPTIEELRLD